MQNNRKLGIPGLVLHRTVQKPGRKQYIVGSAPAGAGGFAHMLFSTDISHLTARVGNLLILILYFTNIQLLAKSKNEF